jgi:hypothetical protein
MTKKYNNFGGLTSYGQVKKQRGSAKANGLTPQCDKK